LFNTRLGKNIATKYSTPLQHNYHIIKQVPVFNYYSSSASLDDQSTNTLEEQPTVTNDGSLQNEAQIHDGNVLLYLPHLDEALQSNACCKQCAERNSLLLIEQFVAFCDLECKSML